MCLKKNAFLNYVYPWVKWSVVFIKLMSSLVIRPIQQYKCSNINLFNIRDMFLPSTGRPPDDAVDNNLWRRFYHCPGSILAYKYYSNANELHKQINITLRLVDRASFINTLFLFQLIHFCFSFYIYNFLQLFSTCFGPAGPSSGESNYTCSIWHLSLIRCCLVRGRWC